jgi:FkbM family methyltransferase
MRRHQLRKLLYYWRSAVTLAAALEPQSFLRILLWKSGRHDLTLRSGLRFEVNDLLDLLVLKETLFDDVYRIGQLRDEPRLIVDVGAGIGDFTVLAASTFPRASILACEPNPQVFALLERNVRSNRLANIDARGIAVGTAAAYELMQPRWSVETSTHRREGSRFRADGIRLEELIGSRRAELVKIDCEGAELDVLESLGGAVRQVEHIAVEYHDHLAPAAGDRVEQFLRAQGFLVTREPDRYDARIGYVYGTAARDDRDPEDVEGHLK